MPIAIAGPQGHSDYRTQLLKDIEYLQTNKGLGKVATDALSSLLTSMASYLKYDQNRDDFGDVDDEELMLAETSTAHVGLADHELKRSFDSEDGSSSKIFKI